MIQVSRLGAYGVALDQNKMLVITQERGPYAGCYDLPGGKIEFGEKPEETLHREFIEETGMDFDSCLLLTNLSALQDVPSINGKAPFHFHQIGLIYQVKNTVPVNPGGVLPHCWIELEMLKKEKMSPFLKEILHDTLHLLS